MNRPLALALITQGWRLALDDWPRRRLHSHSLRTRCQTIDAVTVYDADGEAQDQDLTGYDARCNRARRGWCSMNGPRPGRAINGIEIDFTAGFGAAGHDVPQLLKRAMLMHVAQLYEFRGAVATSDQPAAIPPGYERLIAPCRRRAL